MARVIIVDDSGDELARLVEIATLAGAEVVGQTTSGEEALRLLKTLGPDLVITDFVMSPVNGYQVARATKVPVIVVSSGMEEAWRESLEKIGEHVTALDKRNPLDILQAIQRVLKDLGG